MLWLYITVGYIAFAAGFVFGVWLYIKATNGALDKAMQKNDEWLSCFMRDLKNNRYVRS